MTTKTDFMLQAYRFIEEMPESFVPQKEWGRPGEPSAVVARTAALVLYLQDWALNQGRTTYELFFTSKFGPALILAKTMVEHSVLAFGVMERIWQAKTAGTLSGLGDGLEAVCRHGRTLATDQQVREIPLLFLRVNERFPGFQLDYDKLCRAIHPFEEIWNDPCASAGAGGKEPESLVGLKNLLNALAVFNFSFTQCGLGLPTLARLSAGKLGG